MRIGRANGESWLRLGEAAAELGVSLNTLRRWSDSGKLTCYRSPGGHRRYRRGDLKALLGAEATGAIAPSPAPRRAMTPSTADTLGAPLLVLARVAAEGVGVTECRISLPEARDTFTVFTARSRNGGDARLEDRSFSEGPLPTVREVLRTGRRLVIADLGSTNLLERLEAESLRLRGDTAILAVPLAVDGRNTAVLELVESRAPRAFTGANVTFAEFMARQAAQLLSNGDGTEASDQPGTALPDGLVPEHQASSSRPQDLLLTLAGRLRDELRAVACDILRYDAEGATLEPVAAAAVGEAPSLPGLLYPLADFGPAAEALRSGDAVLIRDLTAVEATGTHLVRREQSGAMSVYAAPINLGREIVGMLEVYSGDAGRALDRAELALVDAAAAIAALALAGDHDQDIATRRVSQLDDLIAGFSLHSPTMDAESLVLSTLQALRTRPTSTPVRSTGSTAASPRPCRPVTTAATRSTAGRRGSSASTRPRRRLWPAVPRSLSLSTTGDPPAPEVAARFLTGRGLRNAVLTPVVFWDRLVGVLELGSTTAQGLSVATHVAQVAADLLAVALGGGDVIARLQRRNRDLALVVEAGLEDTARLSTDEVLHAVVQRLSELTRTPVTDIYAVEGDTLRGLVSYDGGRFDEEWAGVVLPLRRYPCSRRAVETGEIVVAGTLDDPILDGDGRYSLEKWGYQSQLSMPLVSHGHVLGMVELSDYQPRDFAEDLDLIRGLGQVAAHALENASLFEQVDRRSRILNELVELGSLASRTRDTDAARARGRRARRRRHRRGQLRHLPDGGRRPALRRQLRPQRPRRVRAGRQCSTSERYPTTVEAMHNHQILVISSPDDPQLSEDERTTYHDYGFSSEVCLPLVVGDELCRPARRVRHARARLL